MISVVVPVYNEEKSIDPFLKRILPVLERIGEYEIIFSLDPCSDRTEDVIRAAAGTNSHIGLLVFSRRFGQPAAILAGVLNCRGEWCVIIDVDLQDPPELIEALLGKAREGFDVVAAKRRSREGETTLKKLFSRLGYAIINGIADIQIPRNTGEFRIISRRVIEELRRLHERHGFLRGLVPLVGFRQTVLEFDRQARAVGSGSYNRYFGSLKVGFNGMFGFSTVPLQAMMWSGFSIAILSALAVLVMLAFKLASPKQYPIGTPTIIILVLFMGGVQLAAVGILGEYIGRIYDEVRRRPMYIVERTLNVDVIDPRGPA
jgi:polyisoprenyl-phosphate glycosyltransferase